MCKYGYGETEVDYTKAIWYFTKDAKENVHEVQLNLGKMYFEGLGTPINYELALFWFKKAKFHGDDQVQALIDQVHQNTSLITELDALTVYNKPLPLMFDDATTADDQRPPWKQQCPRQQQQKNVQLWLIYKELFIVDIINNNIPYYIFLSTI